MEECQRQFLALSEPCLSHEVEDQLLASEIRYSRKLFREEYDILMKAFELFQFNKIVKKYNLLEGEDDDLIKTVCKKELYCLYDVVEDQSTPHAIQYTTEHLEEDYCILRNALEEFVDYVEVNFRQLYNNPSDPAETSRDPCKGFQTMKGDWKDVLMASGKKFAAQKLQENHENLINNYKDLQEKHAYLWKQLSISKVVDSEVLTDSKRPWRCMYQRGPSVEQNYESVVSEIKFTRKYLEEEYDTLIKAFMAHCADQVCLSEEKRNEDCRLEYDRELSSRVDLRVSQIQLNRKHIDEKFENFTDALRQLLAKARLLEEHRFILIKRVHPKNLRRNEHERGLSKEEYETVCARRVNHTKQLLQAEIDTLILGFTFFQARARIFLGEQTVKYMKQEESPAGPRKQYRTLYEKGLYNVVKDRWLQTWNPKLERNLRLLRDARENLPVEAAGWLEELCSKEAGEDADYKRQWCYVMNEEEVELPEDMRLYLEELIKSFIDGRKDLEEEAAHKIGLLLSQGQAEEDQTDSREECPPNQVEDQMCADELSGPPNQVEDLLYVDVPSGPPNPVEDQLYVDVPSGPPNLVEDPLYVDVPSGPPNPVEDQLYMDVPSAPPNPVEVQSPQAVNPVAELERIIECLINARQNLQAEEASLLAELSSRQPVEGEGQAEA